MFASLLVSLLASTTAVNEEFKTSCEAFQAEYGGTTDCGCLAEKYDEDAELAAALAMIQTPDDAANAPEVVQDAFKACAA
ncbi:MAG: hypothetical protein AAF788_06490 [Pseudomonadota bacterium]